MDGINSISGLNKVSVDFRPEIKVVADSENKKGGIEVMKSEVPRLRQDKGVARSVMQQLDVLLVNAAKLSATANVAKKSESIWQSLQLSGAITEEEASTLASYAKAASKTLAALDKYRGTELAGALCDKGGKAGYGFSTNPKGVMTAVASDVKAAIDAQTKLSDVLYRLTNHLFGNDNLSDEQLNMLTELQLQCDRRATEINSIVCRMHVLAADDGVNGGNADPGVKEMLNAKFMELMPREALMMHGTADSLELMRKHIGDKMGNLAERLDSFAADYNHDLTQEDIVRLQADMATMKIAVSDVAKNGIRFKVDDGIGMKTEVKVDVDKSILKEMEGILSDIEAKLATVRQQCAKNVRTAFLEGVREKLLPKSVPLPESDPTTPFGMYAGAVGRFMKLLADCEDELSDEEIKNELTNIAYDIEASHLNQKLFVDLGYSKEQARGIDGATQSLSVLVDQYKAIVRNTEAFANEGADPMVTAGDIRRMLLGEVGVSSVVEARARGYKAEDVNPKADDSNIVDSRTLGSGQSNTCYLLTTKSGEKFVFKPELESRIGLNVMPLGSGAYSGEQSGANLSIAAADTAKMLGVEDMIVKYSVGTHNGQFGVFMEMAEGFTGLALAVDSQQDNPDYAAVSVLKTEIAHSNDQNKVKGQIAQQLNRLQWLDIIIGQGDRHWENYYINIDRTTHDVKLKAIDNEVSFSEERIGVQKFRFSRRKASSLKRSLEYVCLGICKGDQEQAKALVKKCWRNSAALRINAQRQ